MVFAVPSTKHLLPEESNVREWTLKDIQKLSSDDQKQWKAMCRNELEALKRRKVFELVTLPKGKNTIKNQ
jgi:hypothetical protein